MGLGWIEQQVRAELYTISIYIVRHPYRKERISRCSRARLKDFTGSANSLLTAGRRERDAAGGPFVACEAAKLRVTHPHAAGIDVHANVHWVAVPAEDAPAPPLNHPPNLPPHVRSFGACTADLIALADWLKTCRIRTVVMESTGIYWIPLFELLESRGFEVLLVEPLPHVAGMKPRGGPTTGALTAYPEIIGANPSIFTLTRITVSPTRTSSPSRSSRVARS